MDKQTRFVTDVDGDWYAIPAETTDEEEEQILRRIEAGGQIPDGWELLTSERRAAELN
jgi:hypothetical protein